jgi:hypothetical protein
MPTQKTWAVLTQFALIIVICAAISGIVGGVTSKVASLSSKKTIQQAIQNETAPGNLTMVMRTVGVRWIA